jgi:magnesium transporter
VEVLWVTPDGIEPHRAEDVPSLAARGDGFVWIDAPVCEREHAAVLSRLFDFHPLALQSAMQRSHVPKVHGYQDHVFLVLHGAEPGVRGHIHLLELDQFLGDRYLVTIHGPLGEGVPLESALRDTRAVRTRMEQGRFRPRSPAELSHAIVSRMTRGLESIVSRLATEVAQLERRVRTEKHKDPEKVLEELFLVRHELLTIRTIAAQGREVHARLLSLSRVVPAEAKPLLVDVMDQFERLRAICDEEKEFLQGVVDFYQSRTTTQMNVAMERLALLAALLLPITAVASIYGMNLIVNTETRIAQLFGVLGVMALVTAGMLTWTRRHGWW